MVEKGELRKTRSSGSLTSLGQKWRRPSRKTGTGGGREMRAARPEGSGGWWGPDSGVWSGSNRAETERETDDDEEKIVGAGQGSGGRARG